MAEQILSFAGIQSGRAKYEFEPVEVGGVLAKALAACEQEIRKSGCEVETRIEPDLPPVEADPVSLMHCVRNLIDNAVTHGRKGGRISIRAAPAVSKKGLSVEIQVEDDGAGIEPGDLPRVFEPFYRGRRAVEGQARGFGD
jgi:signal transduction histidine kinase